MLASSGSYSNSSKTIYSGNEAMYANDPKYMPSNASGSTSAISVQNSTKENGISTSSTTMTSNNAVSQAQNAREAEIAKSVQKTSILNGTDSASQAQNAREKAIAKSVETTASNNKETGTYSGNEAIYANDPKYKLGNTYLNNNYGASLNDFAKNQQNKTGLTSGNNKIYNSTSNISVKTEELDLSLNPMKGVNGVPTSSTIVTSNNAVLQAQGAREAEVAKSVKQTSILNGTDSASQAQNAREQAIAKSVETTNAMNETSLPKTEKNPLYMVDENGRFIKNPNQNLTNNSSPINNARRDLIKDDLYSDRSVSPRNAIAEELRYNASTNVVNNGVNGVPTSSNIETSNNAVSQAQGAREAEVAKSVETTRAMNAPTTNAMAGDQRYNAPTNVVNNGVNGVPTSDVIPTATISTTTRGLTAAEAQSRAYAEDAQRRAMEDGIRRDAYNQIKNDSSYNKGTISADEIDYSKISRTAADANKGNFIDREKVHDQYWGDNGHELTYERRADGTILIKEDGVAMGFTTDAGINQNIQNRIDEMTKEKIEQESQKIHDNVWNSPSSYKQTGASEMSNNAVSQAQNAREAEIAKSVDKTRAMNASTSNAMAGDQRYNAPTTNIANNGGVNGVPTSSNIETSNNAVLQTQGAREAEVAKSVQKTSILNGTDSASQARNTREAEVAKSVETTRAMNGSGVNGTPTTKMGNNSLYMVDENGRFIKNPNQNLTNNSSPINNARNNLIKDNSYSDGNTSPRNAIAGELRYNAPTTSTLSSSENKK